MKVIENVVLEEIRKEDGAMRFKLPFLHPVMGNTIWITGWNRPRNVQVGEKGRLVYKTSVRSGLWYFEKYE